MAAPLGSMRLIGLADAVSDVAEKTGTNEDAVIENMQATIRVART
jgi:hypothetical protein